MGPDSESSSLFKEDTLFKWHIEYQKPQNKASKSYGLQESVAINRFIEEFERYREYRIFGGNLIRTEKNIAQSRISA